MKLLLFTALIIEFVPLIFAYNLNIAAPTLQSDLDREKFACSVKMFRAGVAEEGKHHECGKDELGQHAENLEWEKDELCFRFACTRNPAASHPSNANESKIAIRLQECALTLNMKAGRDLHLTNELVSPDGCPAINKAWPTFQLPLHYSRDEISVTAFGWAFNDKTTASFPDELTLSCRIQICEDPCDSACIEKIALGHCDHNSYTEDKNATELCGHPSGNWALRYNNGGMLWLLLSAFLSVLIALAFY